MKKFGEVFQSADWKTEKHIPVIECPDSVKSGEKFRISVLVGKEISHPNTTGCTAKGVPVRSLFPLFESCRISWVALLDRQ
jgi:desulfoferrodoxin (superoxide reductase-like protein)